VSGVGRIFALADFYNPIEAMTTGF
jgi:hypothetical protein